MEIHWRVLNKRVTLSNCLKKFIVAAVWIANLWGGFESRDHLGGEPQVQGPDVAVSPRLGEGAGRERGRGRLPGVWPVQLFRSLRWRREEK